MRKMFGLLLFAAVSLISCEKWVSTSKGKPIDFTTSNITIYDGSIRIACQQATISGSSQKWADYVAAGQSSLQAKESGTELLWGNALHYFFAVYPSGDINDNVVSANIPTTQTGDTRGPAAAAAEDIRGPQAVNLPFKPMYTTVEFVVGPGPDESATVSGFRLESAGGGALAGGFTAALSAQADPAYTITSPSSQVTIPISATTIPAGQTIKLTVIGLPQDLLNLTAYFIVDGEERPLPLVDKYDNPMVIPGCRTTTITATDFLAPEMVEGSARFTVTIEGQDIDDYDFGISN